MGFLLTSPFSHRFNAANGNQATHHDCEGRVLIKHGVSWCRGSTVPQKHQIDFVYLSIYHDLSIRIYEVFVDPFLRVQIYKTFQLNKNVREPL